MEVWCHRGMVWCSMRYGVIAVQYQEIDQYIMVYKTEDTI